MRERVSARPLIEHWLRYKFPFKHFGTEAQPGIKVVLCCRVSTASQEKNLEDQEAGLRIIVAGAGGVVVDVVSQVGWGANPYWLVDAAAAAKASHAILLAETSDRFIRSECYHPSKRPLAHATYEDLVILREAVGEIALMTVSPPNATPGEMRSYQTKRGKQGKGNSGGRPKKREKRFQQHWSAKTIAEALQLYDDGFSQRGAAKMLGVPINTFRYWIRTRLR